MIWGRCAGRRPRLLGTGCLVAVRRGSRAWRPRSLLLMGCRLARVPMTSSSAWGRLETPQGSDAGGAGSWFPSRESARCRAITSRAPTTGPVPTRVTGLRARGPWRDGCSPTSAHTTCSPPPGLRIGPARPAAPGAAAPGGTSADAGSWRPPAPARRSAAPYRARGLGMSFLRDSVAGQDPRPGRTRASAPADESPAGPACSLMASRWTGRSLAVARAIVTGPAMAEGGPTTCSGPGGRCDGALAGHAGGLVGNAGGAVRGRGSGPARLRRGTAPAGMAGAGPRSLASLRRELVNGAGCFGAEPGRACGRAGSGSPHP